MPVLVVGDLCPDIVVTGVPTDGPALRFGQAEELVTATSLTLGGSGALTACAAAAQGGRVCLAAVTGDDVLGRIVLDLVRERGVDVRHVRVDPTRPTGSSVVLVRADDPTDREILTHLGTLDALRADDVRTALADAPRHVHVASFFLHGGLRDELPDLLAQCRRRGSITSLDTNDDPRREWSSAGPALRHTDILFCNDREAVALAGGEHSPDDAVEALLARLPDHPGDPRLPAVVHKLGARGAAVHTRTETVSVAAPTVDVVDTIGAGDSLAGATLAALDAGDDWPLAAALGVAAGSLSTTSPGGLAPGSDARAARELAATLTHTDDRPTREGPR